LIPALRKEGEKILESMSKHNTSVINNMASTHSERAGAYRFINNADIDIEQIKDSIFRHCRQNAGTGHILCIQDTSEINLPHLSGKLRAADKHIGPTGNDSIPGFFIHPSVAISAEDCMVLGLAGLKIWNRHWDKLGKNQRGYKKEAIEAKESYKWIECANQCTELLGHASMVTIIGDRESDIFEEFAAVPSSTAKLLVRSRADRVLEGGASLYKTLRASELAGTYSINIRQGHGRSHRKAVIEVRFCKVRIAKPSNLKTNKSLPDFVEMWAVEAYEDAESVPEGENPIVWRLLTTHEIGSIEDALQAIQWYELRWLIEELFRTIKSNGFRIEDSQLGNGLAIKKICLLSLVAALQCMQLVLARDGGIDKEATLIFTPEEVKFMSIACRKNEGATEKLKNPFIPGSIAWASWTIARLGGWKGYRSQSPPGPITMKKGLDIFFQQYEGYMMALQLQT
jgi:hypothetical protein